LNVLIVGGAGYVAGLFTPAVARVHTVRAFDRDPAADVVGDATDPVALAEAMCGVDAVIHCAMTRSERPADMFDLNVKSVYLTLDAAQQAGVRHAVHISSMSVYDNLKARRLDESVPADACDPYGLSKRLGEEVCHAAAASGNLSVNILRLTWPTPDAAWPAWQPPWQHGSPVLHQSTDGTPIHATAASDLGAAVVAALSYQDGCQVFTISGDTSAALWPTTKARRLLGWAPAFTR